MQPSVEAIHDEDVLYCVLTMATDELGTGEELAAEWGRRAQTGMAHAWQRHLDWAWHGEAADDSAAALAAPVCG